MTATPTRRTRKTPTDIAATDIAVPEPTLTPSAVTNPGESGHDVAPDARSAAWEALATAQTPEARESALTAALALADYRAGDLFAAAEEKLTSAATMWAYSARVAHAAAHNGKSVPDIARMMGATELVKHDERNGKAVDRMIIGWTLATAASKRPETLSPLALSDIRTAGNRIAKRDLPLAERLLREGKSVAAIRKAIDATTGSKALAAPPQRAVVPASEREAEAPVKARPMAEVVADIASATDANLASALYAVLAEVRRRTFTDGEIAATVTDALTDTLAHVSASTDA